MPGKGPPGAAPPVTHSHGHEVHGIWLFLVTF